MKHKNRFRKFYMHSNVPDGEPAGGGGSPEGDIPGPANTGENNAGTNEPDYVNLWNDAPAEDDPDKKQQQQQQVNQDDPEAAMQKHLENLNLTGGIDASKIINDMNSGNMESFTQAFSTVANNAYKAALADANKLIDSKLDSTKKDLVNQTRGDYKSEMLIADMHKELPYTKSAEIEPIAKAVLTRFMKMGKSPNDAVKEVDKFFNHVSTKISGVSGAPDNSPGSRGFRGRNSQSTGEPDWLDILAGGNSDD